MHVQNASAAIPHNNPVTKTIWLLRQDRDYAGSPKTLAVYDTEWAAHEALALLQKADAPGALDIEPIECCVGAGLTPVHR